MKLDIFAADETRSDSRRICVYGPPKCGKTKIAGDLSARFNLLYLDLENGYKTLLQLPAAQQRKIEYVRIPDSKNYPIALETVLKIFSGKPVSVCAKHGKCGCPVCTKAGAPQTAIDLSKLDDSWVLVLDSATQLAASALNSIIRGQPDDYKVEWEDYRRQGALLSKVFSNLQQSEFNCVVLTHETMVEMEDKSIRLVPVCGTSNASRTFAKYFDDVVYMRVIGGRHAIYSKSTAQAGIITGSRAGVDLSLAPAASLLPLFDATQPAQPVITASAPKVTKPITAAVKEKPSISVAVATPVENKLGVTGESPTEVPALPQTAEQKESEVSEAIAAPADTVVDVVTPIATSVADSTAVADVNGGGAGTLPEKDGTIQVINTTGHFRYVATLDASGKPLASIRITLNKNAAIKSEGPQT